MRSVVLVADDDSAVRFVIEVALKREGLEVITAQDGAECMAVAASGAPDAILLDLRMPVIDGIEVLKRRSTWDPSGRIPVIVISGTDDTADFDAIGAAPVVGVLHKPFDLVDLITVVLNAVRGSAPGGADVTADQAGNQTP
ncbi:MAG: response regulator [Firmicutes bacterium]|nr:response regulator [Bacillota bacterium]